MSIMQTIREVCFRYGLSYSECTKLTIEQLTLLLGK